MILCDGEVILAEDIPLDRSKTTGTLAETLEENEKLFLLRKLEENDWNVSETARQLGITRTVLYRRLNKHGISKQ